MNLNDLEFNPIPSQEGIGLSALKIQPAKVESVMGEVIEDDFEGCTKCGVEGSQKLPNGTCDVCGASWAEPSSSDSEESDEDEDEFEIALGLLTECANGFDLILSNKKLLHKMNMKDEIALRDLAVEVSDYLEGYESSDAGASD